MPIKTIEKCIICGGADFEPYLNGALGKDILICLKCSLVFTWPRPSIEHLKKRYEFDYYSHWITPRQRKRRIKLWKGRLKIVQSLKPKAKILDVGCGTGLFLHLCKEAGYSVSGVEISPDAVEYAKRAFGLNVYHGTLEDLQFEGAFFDIITFWHTIEHLLDPVRTLRRANGLLKDDGYLLVAVPNVEAKISHNFYRLLKGRYCPLYSPLAKEPHLFLFSTRTLKLLLEKCRFMPIKITQDFARIDPYWKLVSWFSFIFSKITNKRWYDCILMIAKKK